MHNVIANLQNELQKMLAAKKTFVLLGVSFLIPLTSAWLLTGVQSGFGVSIGDTSQFMMLMVSLFTSVFLPLFIGMAAIDLFTGEFHANTMKGILVRPIFRWKVYVSKVLALAVYLSVHLAVVWLSSALATALLGKGSWLAGTLSGLQAFALSLFPMLTFGLIIVFLAQFFKSGSSALVFGILFYLAAMFLPVFFPKLSALSPTSYFDWYKQWMGSAVSDWKLMRSSLFLVSAGSLFFTLGLTMFEKRDY